MFEFYLSDPHSGMFVVTLFLFFGNGGNIKRILGGKKGGK